MSKAHSIFVLGLAVGAALGFVASGGIGIDGLGTKPGTATDQSTGMSQTHDHGETREVPASAVPAVSLRVVPESPCTFNLAIEVSNFVFAPDNVNGPHVDGEGHAHLYANGVKLARIYGPHFHATAPAGSTDITVTLNSNDHAIYTHNAQPITATAPLVGC